MKSINEMYGEVIAELRRRKFTAELRPNGVLVGVGNVSLIIFEIVRSDLERTVSDICDEVVLKLNEYLDMEKNDDLDIHEEKMNSLHSKRIRQNNVLQRSNRLLNPKTKKDRG